MAGLLLTLRGHTHNLSSVQFSPDGQRIVTASVDNTVRVWNAADGRLLATLQGHTGYIPHARFSPDGKRIVTASWDQTPRVWEVLTLDDVSRILGN
jgi:WD40 repeat protein